MQLALGVNFGRSLSENQFLVLERKIVNSVSQLYSNNEQEINSI